MLRWKIDGNHYSKFEQFITQPIERKTVSLLVAMFENEKTIVCLTRPIRFPSKVTRTRGRISTAFEPSPKTLYSCLRRTWILSSIGTWIFPINVTFHETSQITCRNWKCVRSSRPGGIKVHVVHNAPFKFHF